MQNDIGTLVSLALKMGLSGVKVKELAHHAAEMQNLLKKQALVIHEKDLHIQELKDEVQRLQGLKTERELQEEVKNRTAGKTKTSKAKVSSPKSKGGTKINVRGKSSSSKK
tara:strand:+ start:6345 stop:6677 length:333 start_codon:yes stop_codon:yes gene_type:complete